MIQPDHDLARVTSNDFSSRNQHSIIYFHMAFLPGAATTHNDTESDFCNITFAEYIYCVSE